MSAIDTRQFRDAFMSVAAYYNLAELGELEAAKRAVRDDPEAAAESYAIMAKEAAA